MKLDKTLKEALATHQALRKFGFSSDDIYAILEPGRLIMLLKAQNLEFAVDCGNFQCSEVDFPVFWADVAEYFNTCSISIVKEIWDNSWISQNLSQLKSALKNKGLKIPLEVN